MYYISDFALWLETFSGMFARQPLPLPLAVYSRRTCYGGRLCLLGPGRVYFRHTCPTLDNRLPDQTLLLDSNLSNISYSTHLRVFGNSKTVLFVL